MQFADKIFKQVIKRVSVGKPPHYPFMRDQDVIPFKIHYSTFVKLSLEWALNVKGYPDFLFARVGNRFLPCWFNSNMFVDTISSKAKLTLCTSDNPNSTSNLC